MVLWIIVYITTFTVMLGMHAYIPNSGVCRVIDDISMQIAQIILRAILVAFDFVRLVIEYTTLIMRAVVHLSHSSHGLFAGCDQRWYRYYPCAAIVYLRTLGMYVGQCGVSFVKNLVASIDGEQIWLTPEEAQVQQYAAAGVYPRTVPQEE